VEQSDRQAVLGSMKDPLLLMVSVAIARIVGVLANGTAVTIHDHTAAVQNNQTDVEQHH